jgi:ABC-type nitrate/sulfonate/bicarbonate transport system ATPase subunit
MIIIQNLSITYADKILLQGIDFSVSKGEFISIIGPSGCGKTTFLNTIADFDLPDFVVSGKIVRPKSIGYIFQESSLFQWMNVRQNLLFGLKNRDINVDNFLINIGLCGMANYYPNQLSGGQKQRLALGQTIINNPDLILMDEPFGSLDDFSRREIWSWLKEITLEFGLTVIMVTHSIDEAEFLSEKIYKLENMSLK